MAFSPQEIELLRKAKQEGKTKEQALGLLAQSRNSQTSTPAKESVVDRVKGVIGNASQTVRNAVTGQGEYAGQNPLQRGVEATAATFNTVPQTAMAVAPEPVRNAAEAVGEKVNEQFNKLTQFIGSNPDLQKWVMDNPDATDKIINTAKTFQAGGEIAGTILSAQGTANTLQKGADLNKAAATKAADTVSNTAQTVKTALTPTAEQIASERNAKMVSGLSEQNTRLKTADKAFTKNTITRVSADGKTKTKITPIDTFVKNDIAPVIEKGSIQMGDYKLGEGELGKIKVKVSALDDQISDKLVKSGQSIKIADLEMKAFEDVMKNPEFKQSGTVGSNVSKLEARFNDYRASYGDSIDIGELNNIRKTANMDFSPDTQDLSRVIGDTSRAVIYKSTPDGSVKKLLQQQGELLAARKYAEAINGTKVTGGRLGNMAMRTGGAVIGTTVQSAPIVGPALGMIGGEFAARALQQSQFKSLWTELRAKLVPTDQKGSVQ